MDTSSSKNSDRVFIRMRPKRDSISLMYRHVSVILQLLAAHPRYPDPGMLFLCACPLTQKVSMHGKKNDLGPWNEVSGFYARLEVANDVRFRGYDSPEPINLTIEPRTRTNHYDCLARASFSMPIN